MQRVKSLVKNSFDAGKHSVTWDGVDNSGKLVDSGIYFYKILTPDYTSVKKMIMLK